MLVEVLTSMRRHGIAVEDLPGRGRAAGPGRLPGLDHPPAAARRRPLRRGRAAGPGRARRRRRPAVVLPPAGRGGRRPGPPARRRGRPTRCPYGCGWAPGSGSATSRPGRTTATVLDVHRIRARRSGPATGSGSCPADGWIVVVAGGTSHGIGLEAPTSASTVAAAGDRPGHRLAGGGRPGAQPVHDQRQEALVPRAAAHAVQPDLPARPRRRRRPSATRSRSSCG